MASLERQYFWGCTLTKDKPEFKWLGSKDKENVGEVDILNQLALSQACLGPKAKDAPNVVQVTTKGVNDNTITQPIIVLGSGVRQVQCRLEFSVAATFRLIEGNGPVHLSGSHIQVLSDAYDDSDEDEDEETIGADLLPKKPSPSPTKEKRPNAATSEKERPPAKKAKLEVENGHAESSDDEPDVLIPINKKEEKPKETKGKDDKTKKKSVVDETKAKQKKAPISAAKKAKMDVDESEDEDDEDDSEDDDDDDFDDDEDDEDDDEDDEDDEDDDDDDDDDDDEDDEDDDEDEDDDDDDDESDEEPSKKVTPSSKAKPQQKAKNTPTAKNQTPIKQTPSKQTHKKGNMDASINLTKTPDLNTVKQKLLKSPNLPKKMDRFKNFMKTNMKISDEKIVKDMWTFVQANKK